MLLTQNELIYSINFVCSRYDVDVHGQELDLMKCRAWALVNCASIDVHYTPNIMALSFQIHKILF
ncbi:hypothetical protein Trichorick_00210 [Candidatus Trichorickettsia mobilis]|uniref:Uncharacterized protein n=1 Tax=Candidatus Trichorickettsia mobilis TaxID=1346319 RepID=A0ABZ0UTN6_9RICK|nr:hypothetical protein Trichorick_00210 [Candidatus Trichorickettsia mobilis]